MISAIKANGHPESKAGRDGAGLKADHKHMNGAKEEVSPAAASAVAAIMKPSLPSPVMGAAAAVASGPRRRPVGEGTLREGTSLGETLNAMESMWEQLMILGYWDDRSKEQAKKPLNRYHFALEASAQKGLSRHQQFQDFVEVSHWLLARLGCHLACKEDEDAPMTITTEILTAAQVSKDCMYAVRLSVPGIDSSLSLLTVDWLRD